MPSHFTLGVEEEFQLVDRQSGDLRSASQKMVEKGAPIFEDRIKVEMVQSNLEVISRVCPDIAAVRSELYTSRRQLLALLEPEGLVPVSASTHPTASWQQQKITPFERYTEIEERFQDAVRTHLIFGLHIHVGVESKDIAIAIMNQARNWLPHLVALSANSPFWMGRFTGIKSYRQVIWTTNPRVGIPDILASWSDFERYVDGLVKNKCITDGREIWWDIRPHSYFDTIEFRICDMPATIEDTIALTALCQALIAKLVWLHKRQKSVPTIPSGYINENKWYALRYGLDAEIVDFAKNQRMSMRDSVQELLSFVEEVIDDLGSRREIEYLRRLLTHPHGTGADRQIDVYQRTGDIQQVIKLLIEQSASLPDQSSRPLAHSTRKVQDH